MVVDVMVDKVTDEDQFEVSSLPHQRWDSLAIESNNCNLTVAMIKIKRKQTQSALNSESAYFLGYCVISAKKS